MVLPFISFGQDPGGATTGNINDVTAAAAGKPTLQEIGAQAGHNKIAINIMWTLITGFLVMFMQAGFAMVETGFTQKKNVAHTMAMNFLVYGLGVLGFWICGFAFMFGGGLNVASLGGAAGVLPTRDRDVPWLGQIAPPRHERAAPVPDRLVFARRPRSTTLAPANTGP